MNTKILKLKRGMLAAVMALVATLAVAAPSFAQRQTPPTPVPPAQPPAPFSEGREDDRRIIEGDQTISGGSYTLQADETLQGDLNVFGGTAQTEAGSIVEGSVNVFGGTLDIAGRVQGDVNVVGGTARLRKGAVVEGKLTTVGGTIKRDIGAVTHGGTTTFNGPLPPLDRIFDEANSRSGSEINIGREVDWFDRWDSSFADELAGMILATLLAIVVIALIPNNIARTIDTARSQLVTAGAVGGLSWVAVPVAVLLLTLTLCLIPGAILLALAWGVGIFVGWTAVARWLGERMMIGFGKRDWTLVGQTAAGAFVLALLGALPLVGWLIGLLASSVGLGALILTRLGTQGYPPRGLQVYTPTSQGSVGL